MDYHFRAAAAEVVVTNAIFLLLHVGYITGSQKISVVLFFDFLFIFYFYGQKSTYFIDIDNT